MTIQTTTPQDFLYAQPSAVNTLQVTKLTVRYGHHAALESLNFTLTPGITGLLGPNGAGKSTLIHVLTTLRQVSSGAMYWNGEDVTNHPDKVRRVLGYVPQEARAYPQLNPVEFLRYMGAAKGLAARTVDEQIAPLLESLNLTRQVSVPIGALSGGMRQRIALAQALLGDPQLLVLDEPTTGLDPEERERVRELLMQQSKRRIVIMATHILDDLDACADFLLVLQQGRLLFHGRRTQFLHEFHSVSGVPSPGTATITLETALKRYLHGTEQRSEANHA